jgi:hypothetical protein
MGGSAEWPDDYLVVCPHCYGRSPECCVCGGLKVMTRKLAISAMGNIWDRARCSCRVCQDLRRMKPKGGT